MSKSPLDVACSEYKNCLVELRKSTAFQNAEVWKQIIRSLGGTLPEESAKIKVTPPARDENEPQKGKQARIKAHAKDVIREKGGYAGVQAIHDYVTEQGESIKIRRLSAILSADPEFVGHRVKGWSVKSFAA